MPCILILVKDLSKTDAVWAGGLLAENGNALNPKLSHKSLASDSFYLSGYSDGAHVG